MIKSILFIFICVPVFLFGQTNSTSVSEQINLIKNLINVKKHIEAEEALKNLLKSKISLSNSDSVTIYELRGFCFGRLQQYDKASQEYEYVLNAVMVNDTQRAMFLYQLSLSYYRMSDYAGATSQLISARDIYRKLFGADSKEYNTTLNTLGFFYFIQARYSEAEKTYLEARQINLRRTGGEDIQYARIINNLADVYTHLNRYDQADELYKTSLRIKEKISGKQSIDYSKTLFNLADFQASLGKYDKAKATLEEGIAIFNFLNETKLPEYLKFLDYLAILNEKTGNSEKAEKLHFEALKQRESSSLINRDDYALNLMNLGDLYYNRDKMDQALVYIEKAKPLIENIFGKTHPTYAKILITLANIQAKGKDNIKAKANYEEAIRTVQRSLGKDNIECFQTQFAYARFLRSSGNKKEAIQLLQKIDNIPRLYLKRATRFLSEKELNDKIEEYKSFTSEIYSFLRENPNDPDLIGLAYNTTLYYRGYILNQLQRIRLSMQKVRQVSDIRDEVISLHRQLENEFKKPLDERVNTGELEQKISEKEAEIARTLGSFGEEEKEILWEDVQLALGENDAAIEFLSYSDPNIKDSVYYAAIILDSKSNTPQFINLCNQSAFTSFFPEKIERKSDYINSMYSFSSRGAATVEENKISLAELIWTPIKSKLHGIKRMFIIPDGLINRIALAALPTSLETVVADSIELIILNSSRQVVPGDSRILAYSSNKSLVLGGVDYDKEPTEVFASRASGGAYWGYLPWAEKESNEVTKILKDGQFIVHYLHGKDANEKTILDSLTNSNDWRILHFATHGYFNDKSPDAKVTNSGFYGSGMMNSGLVLAGANDLKFNPSSDHSEDGLLSAYEVSRLNLSQTELVVLSACETALGDLKEVEGVYGLQRAFKLSGAGQLIMSLWQVPDRETKDFMTSFYKYWINEKISIRQAFLKTQTEFRQRFVNPYQWAGFVLLE